VVTLIITLAPGVVDQARSVVDRQQWFAQWQGPPADATVEDVLPLHVAETSRQDVTTGPGPELVAFDGNTMLHSTYRGDEVTIEVWATRASAEERDAYFARANAAIAEGDYGMVTRSLIGQVLTLRFGRPSTSIALWWGDDWLFCFVAEEGTPLGSFPDQLLRLIERDAVNPSKPSGQTP
jgi:hypothetical protein